MNKNRKNLHKATVNMLGLTIASVMTVGAVADVVAAPLPALTVQAQKKEAEKVIYLDVKAKASKDADGTTKAKAVNSLAKALELVGAKGEILVTETIVIDKEQKLVIPENVVIKKEKGFKGKLIKILGEGKLVLAGKEIAAEEIDLTEAKFEKDAYQIVKEIKPDELSKPEEPKEELEKEPEAEVEPEEPKEEPEKEPEAEVEPEEPKEEPGKEPETEVEPEEPKEEPEKEPEAEVEPEEPKEESEKEPEVEVEPEEPKEEEKLLEMPDEITLKEVKEWEKFQFEEAGFKGKGTFAWEDKKAPEAYESEVKVRFTPENTEKQDYSQIEGWDAETKTVVVCVKVFIEELKEEEKLEEAEPEEPKKEEVVIIPVETSEAEPEEAPEISVNNSAQPGKLGEVAEEVPEAIPVGSLIDESGVQVSADFLPFYVDLQVTYNEAVNELPDAGIGEILSAYELKLWNLKDNTEYVIPEGKKVKVLIPLPENADCYSDLAIAHYLGNNQYEYFIFDRDGKIGNMTVEEKEGVEYLAFETGSFSPFNVGGHQIVGPGTSSSGHKPPVVAQKPVVTQKPAVTQKPGASSSTQKKPVQSATAGSGGGNKVIYTVQTGDGTEIARYVVLGAGALALGAAVVGKKKKKENE